MSFRFLRAIPEFTTRDSLIGDSLGAVGEFGGCTQKLIIENRFNGFNPLRRTHVILII